jgi:hypothetical protein
VRVACVNRWLPRGPAHPDMLPGTGEVQHASMGAWRLQVDLGLHETAAGGDGRLPSAVGDSQRGDAIDQARCEAAPLPGGSLTIRLQAAGRTEDAGHMGVASRLQPVPSPGCHRPRGRG